MLELREPDAPLPMYAHPGWISLAGGATTCATMILMGYTWRAVIIAVITICVIVFTAR